MLNCGHVHYCILMWTDIHVYWCFLMCDELCIAVYCCVVSCVMICCVLCTDVLFVVGCVNSMKIITFPSKSAPPASLIYSNISVIILLPQMKYAVPGINQIIFQICRITFPLSNKLFEESSSTSLRTKMKQNRGCLYR